MSNESSTKSIVFELCERLEYPSYSDDDYIDMEDAAKEIRYLLAKLDFATQALRAAKAGFYLWENGHAFDSHGAAREYDNAVTETLRKLEG